jgi:hypothetical protein
MRYRRLDENGDALFGRSQLDFLVDTPETVTQAVRTRLGLLRGQWFLDTEEGLNTSQILGYGTQSTYDWAIRERILGTQGVTEITAYDSQFDPDSRALTVQATISTQYGTTTVEATL